MRSGKSPTDFRDEVAGDAITLPEFWSANGACAFVLKSSFNSLYDPFGSPCRGQKPSLPLKKAPPLISVFFNGLYTPFGSPVWGQKPQGRRGKPPYSVLEPLRFIVGGASKPCAMLCGMGPPWVERRFANI